jgi:hypothetical protein
VADERKPSAESAAKWPHAVSIDTNSHSLGRQFEHVDFAEEELLQEDKRDPELLAYKERTSHGTDAEDSIEWRQEFLFCKFFEAVPDIELRPAPI